MVAVVSRSGAARTANVRRRRVKCKSVDGKISGRNWGENERSGRRRFGLASVIGLEMLTAFGIPAGMTWANVDGTDSVDFAAGDDLNGLVEEEGMATAIEPEAPPPPPPKRVVDLKEMRDETLAYTVPVPSSSGLHWVTTRKPEKYSSAPPLTPDARQRVVFEMIDFKKNVTATVSVGPPAPESPLALTPDKPLGELNPKAVATGVLLDRVASARRSDGTRGTVARVEESGSKTVDGITYFNYVYVLEVPGTVSEGPSQAARFRRSISSSAVRNGYIYTLTFSSASSMWDEYGPDFFEATQQFRVDSSPEKNPKYRSPESAPWEIF